YMGMEISGNRPQGLLLDMETSLAPNPGDRRGDFYYNNSESNFNSNMVVVLAALLLALICALGLNSIAHCALRYSHRSSSSPETRPEQAASNLAARTSQKNSAFIGQNIPEVTYEPGVHIVVIDCPICLGEFAEGEKMRVLPKCNHGFHAECIDKWLCSHSSCPLCRQLLIDDSRHHKHRLLLDMEASMPPSHASRTGDFYYSSETNFDANMIFARDPGRGCFRPGCNFRSKENYVDQPDSRDCPICLGELAEGEKVRVLPKCNHGFH
ncbi:hypothetical protein Tsubulata_007345, partial [Turnera subulata]